ncbi:P-loop containing nucleoside triphosphate hydrolase protein [Tirmania nivea]|nr:P-loop containing nucleoside triphosphate hydrolase protein [Tirmania nivea]
MPPITPQQITSLQKNSENIRNICILAHVDHGKTSLSDCLLATNGIISPKLAGRVRYLDSRPDEQLRGITMESSAISLFFKLMRRPGNVQEPVAEDYLINLIDSPGHIDFSSEVSTASRLCDGALVLVDAVEGVCSQTETVLRQTWIEHIRPVLVINKMDRLITELKLSPMEAYTHISKLLEAVNAVMGSFFAGERMEEDLRWREQAEKRKAKKVSTAETDIGTEADAGTMEFEEKDDEGLYFAPEDGNVIFASAIDGWAFTVKQFASIYERKLGFKRTVLEKVLWGDFYLDPKTRRVLGQKHLKGRNLKPMFVQLVLETLWAVYESTVLKRDQEKVEKIVKSLNLKVLPRDMKSKDTKALLTTIFAQWLPLSTAVLVSVIEQLPSPPVGQKKRIPLILDATPGHEDINPNVRGAMVEFDKRPDTPVVAYVSKMVAVPESELRNNTRQQLSAEEMREIGRQKRMALARKLAEAANEAGDSTTDHVSASNIGFTDVATPVADEEAGDKEHLIGFARLYSGTIKVGQELYVLGPKYNPSNPTEHVHKITVTELYYMMGRDLQVLDEVPAGNVFGIGGLEGKILKNGTLCSVDKGGVNFAGLGMGGTPIVRVAVEPKNPSELNKMIEGLKMLEQADPCVEYIMQDNGEHVILTAGELHLERCLKDLRERFARIEIQSSPPVVPFRETIVSVPDMTPPKEKDLPRGMIVATTPSKSVTIKIQTRPLPKDVTEYLVKNSLTIKKLHKELKEREGANKRAYGEANAKRELDEDDALLEAQQTRVLSVQEFKKGLQEIFDKECPLNEREIWAGVVDKIAAFGPRRIGPNILVDATGARMFRPLLSDPATTQLASPDPASETAGYRNTNLTPYLYHSFQLFTSSGPLCHEPLQGVAIFIHSATLHPTSDYQAQRLRGEMLTLTQSCLRSTFGDWSPRLLLATYLVTILCPPTALGKVYSVLTRRRGRILSEEMREGTPYFTVTASLPVRESFGFSDELRKRTSGEAASPAMGWGGYEVVVDEDPWWEPRTEEELEDWGEGGGVEKEGVQLVKGWVEEVRIRKGLFVQGRKLVVGAEKQKTLKR